MPPRKPKPTQDNRIKYKLLHHLIGKSVRFDSWTTLCEYVLEVAEKEAKEQLEERLMHLICTISDEIIDTAIECQEEESES